MKYILFFALFCQFSCSCQKEEPLIWTQLEMLDMVKKGDEKVIIKLPSKESEVIRCTDYTPNCKASLKYIVRELEMIALEFHSEEEAKLAAREIKGYYSRNWVFDDVRSEPIL